MARKVRTSKTPEQRKAEAEGLHATIAAEVENLRTETNWTRFLDFSRHMNRYSLNNLLLILAANPEATAVAGYQTWQGRGYQVRKGEKAIRIFGGRSVTEAVEDPATGEEADKRRMLYFAVPVFDISQCDPIDPDAAVIPIVVNRLTGDDPAGIYDATVDYLTAQGWTVTREPIPGEANGYTTLDDTKRIVIDSRLSPAQMAKTALHEAAHALLHASDAPGEYVVHRGVKETEAESVAYVTAGLLGLSTAEYSFGYVASWSDCDPQIIKDTAERVLRCSRDLADALTTTEPDATDGAAHTARIDVERPTTEAKGTELPTSAPAPQVVAAASISRPDAVTAMADVPASASARPPEPDNEPPPPATIEAAADALMAQMPRHATDLMEAIVYLGAHSEWDSETVEALAGPIQRAALDAGLPPFGSTGPDSEHHAYYGALARTAGIDTDWQPEPADVEPLNRPSEPPGPGLGF
ncbi:ArdC-like ssDNA-binding domain-containing protein [Xylanimonas oleitrophica]|uniref:ArdC-like ssDNA-binding domain-containing protein n=1 Tax=Xylanimonas oleitrophica TaxID=2607479 RepID=UPI001C54FD75|nr:ArdC-like ssDNA-binding domain-containing protein [Xylanimonas oleitrophica]